MRAALGAWTVTVRPFYEQESLHHLRSVYLLMQVSEAVISSY